MARVPLRDVVLTDQFKGQARLEGAFYVYQAGTTTAATVYGASTGTTTVTQPVPYNDYVGQVGWVEAGEYTLSCRSFTMNVSCDGGDAVSAPTQAPFNTPLLAAQNFPYNNINSMACTTTSQLAKFVKVVPSATLASVGKVVSASGTAIATITGSFVGLYTSDGTTLTRVAVSATNTSSGLWDTNNTMYRQAITPTTNTIYGNQTVYVGMLVNATTGGSHAGFVKTTNLPAIASTELSDPPMYTLAAQTSLPASTAISGLTAAYDLVPWVALTA